MTDGTDNKTSNSGASASPEPQIYRPDPRIWRCMGETLTSRRNFLDGMDASRARGNTWSVATPTPPPSPLEVAKAASQQQATSQAIRASLENIVAWGRGVNSVLATLRDRQDEMTEILETLRAERQRMNSFLDRGILILTLILLSLIAYGILRN